MTAPVSRRNRGRTPAYKAPSGTGLTERALDLESTKRLVFNQEMKPIFQCLLSLLLTVPATRCPAAPAPAKAGTHAADSGGPTAPRLECFAASDLVRVFEDGYGQPEPRPATITLFGLRNEIVSAQCVVAANADLENLTIAVGALKLEDGSATIPAGGVAWDFVGSIFIEKNSPNRRPASLTRPAPAWFPDYLGEERQCALPKGARKAVYLTIRIPRDTPPGEYRAAVSFAAGDDTASLPLSLRVYPLTLPDTRHAMVTEWYSGSQFAKHHGLDAADEEGFFRMLKVYADNMADHRQNVFRVSLDLIGGARAADGKLTFDFARFDRWAQIFWDTRRMDLLETGFVAHFGKGGWSSNEILLRDFMVKDMSTGRPSPMPGEEYLRAFLPALVGHLREKGWLAKTVFHICDEPSAHNVMAWRKAAEFVREWAPELRRIDAIETPHCLGDLEVWVPKLDHLATWRDAYEDARRQGNELWFYTVGIFQGGSLLNKTADVPLIESRLMHWLNYRFGLKGYLHWGFNAWTDDPIRAPGQHRGDGWHVYPKPDGLLNSIRWEQMRNGLQDHECLCLLEEKTASMRAKLSKRVASLIDPSRRGIEIASQVVATYHDCTRDPTVLYGAKRQTIEETLDLDRSPRILLQTNPPEHTPVASGCAVDVHGWAEPGTTLTINGATVAVASDGLFLHQASPSRAEQIVVEAQGANAKKTLVRIFPTLP
ncbi:MAG TPA: DUF4091 domain-containing protein [Verrucomicrobiae bacterium]|nr:DUF4091 domain-containing protein [Verrucomicrobiae bacterium]